MMQQFELVKWTEFKAFVTARSLSIQFREDDSFFYLKAIDAWFALSCNLHKTDNASDVTDFETNFEANGNRKILITDSDGAELSRTKITQTGWAYKLHSLEVETAKTNSVVEKKPDNTDYGYTTIKHYKDVDGVETLMTSPTQSELTTDCIKTVVEWEPTHDYEILGGLFMQQVVPSTDIRMWVVGVPDVPEAYGGSKVFVSSLNLKYVSSEEGIKVDGRAPKYMTYSATNHTNKLQMIFRHGAGLNHKVSIVFEIFKT